MGCEPNVVVEFSTLLLLISQVLGSNFGPAIPNEDFRCFSQSLQANSVIVPSN
jgi:hypothetical protein